MNKLTVSNIVKAINGLPKNKLYNYIGPKTSGNIKIMSVQLPEGPIKIKRFDPRKSQTLKRAREVSISHQMISRFANAFTENQPVNVDRVLGASYNTRSVLESLMAHTPQFYYCYPGRTETINGITTIKHGHKHLMWVPENPHTNGKIQEMKTDIVISEIPSMNAYYDALQIPNMSANKLDIAIARRHAQIQVALIMIGKQLGFRTWVANNDKGIIYENKKLVEHDSVIKKLEDEKLIVAHEEAIKAAFLIDCIWFKNSRLMPAVIEIEDTTGIVRGLSRMKNFQDKVPPFPTRYVIAAEDDERSKVMRHANEEQYKPLNIKFFSYSAIEELYALCQKRKIRGVTEDFLDCYMEPIVFP